MTRSASRSLTCALLVGALVGVGSLPALAEQEEVGSTGAVLVSELAARTSVPAPSRALPAALDARPTYQGGVSCDPVDRPGATRLVQLLRTTYGTGTFGITRFCNGSTSEHHEGRAVDWMLDANNPAHRQVADAFHRWLTANDGAMARRLGVQYVIWNKQSWRAYAPERGWTAYTGASPHTDHIHISLTWDGAMGRTSWWSGRAVTTQDRGTCRVYTGQPAPLYTGVRTAPCPATTPPPPTTFAVRAIGARHADVAVGQRALGLPADGVFGKGTQSAVLAYQRARGLPLTGALDNATWARLVPAGTTSPPTAPRTTPAPAPSTGSPAASGPTTRVPATVVRPLAAHKGTVLRLGSSGPAVRAVQGALGVRVTGRYDAATVRAVTRVQARWKLAQSGRTDLRTWNRIELTRYPWLGHTSTTLRRGSSGPAVVALQRALKISADGRFGPGTQRAVAAVQTRYGLRATGVVDAATWRAISHYAR